jgi:hypothetical protein
VLPPQFYPHQPFYPSPPPLPRSPPCWGNSVKISYHIYVPMIFFKSYMHTLRGSSLYSLNFGEIYTLCLMYKVGLNLSISLH